MVRARRDAVPPLPMVSSTAWIASSPPGPRMAAPRIASVSASTTKRIRPARVALLDGAGDARHRAFGDQDAAPGRARVGEREADAAERRVGVERVGGDPIADAPVLAVEQVGGDDLAVVEGGVGESAAAVAIAERPDATCAGLETVVDGDEAPPVGGDAGAVEAEIAGVGDPAECHEQMAADHRRTVAGADGDTASIRRDREAGRAEAEDDALAFEDDADRVGDVGILAREQPVVARDDRDGGAEAPEHLRVFERDIRAAEHDEMVRDVVEREDGAVRQRIDLVEPRDRGTRGAAAHVEEDPWRAETPVADLDRVARDEAGMAADQGHAVGAVEPGLEPFPRLPRDPGGAAHRPRQIDRHRSRNDDAELGGAAGRVRDRGAGDERLGRRAAGVDAGAADAVPLDDRDAMSGGGEPCRERRTGLAGADDEGVEGLGGIVHRGSPVGAMEPSTDVRGGGAEPTSPRWRSPPTR